MKWSNSFLFTKKESPADAEIPSHQLMVRAGLLKKVGPGVFTYGYFCLRSIRKLEQIVRRELDAIGCQEILMPMVQPRSLWEETGRWEEMGDLLLKFQNRNEQWYCLGGTHEEVVTDFVRNDLQSYKNLPQIVYQIQTKYRDEIRPRFGLMRGREFIMKDAYSFDLSEEAAQVSYQKLYQAYERIFHALGLDFRIVEADTGNIGGSQSHEFQLLADAGEDQLMICKQCDYASNIEITPVVAKTLPEYDGKKEGGFKEEFATKGLRSIKDLANHLSEKEENLVKTLFYADEEGQAYCILTRGSDTANEVKIKKVLGLANPPRMLEPEEVKQLTSAMPGSCGPVGLNIPTYIDQHLKNFKNFVVGANRDDFHLMNVNLSDFANEGFHDLIVAQEADACPNCGGSLYTKRGIEVGHCFYLGTKYSKSMNATFLDQNGKAQLLEMGCYGLGVSRTVQAAIEASHDKDGIIWPMSIAPFQVHICNLDPDSKDVDPIAQKFYEDLQTAGVDVFMDDRKERPGVKFKDADLLGFPVRVTMGAKSIANGEIEIVQRRTKESEKVKIDAAVAKVLGLIKG
tara:strand:- start:436 stop:2148 length:1713 start_codon:yes stop_codon:yes gene_type:complete